MKEQTWRQIAAAGVVNIGISLAGFNQGWVSPVSAKLQDVDQSPLDYPVTTDQLAWIASLIIIGMICGPFPAGLLVRTIGRKWTLLASTMPMLLGFILIAAAMDIWMIYVGRFATGFGITMMFTVSPMYCAEIATDDIRGALGSFLSLFLTFGILLAYSVGPYVSYLGLSLVGIGLLLLFMVLGAFLPESPIYLLTKDDREGAAASLLKLRGGTRADIEQELNKMTEDVTNSARYSSEWSNLLKGGNFKALYVCCALMMAQQFSGINAVLNFMSDIFGLAGSSLDASVASIIVAAVNLLAEGMPPLLVDRVGRRVLLLSSMAGSAAGLFALGVYFYLNDAGNPIADTLSFLPLVAMMLFIIMYGIGLGPLPWTVLGELMSIEVKNKAAPVVTIYMSSMAFLVTRFFNPVAESVGMSVTFWIFGGCCLISFLFTYFVVPETKGKTYQEIQDGLWGRYAKSGSTEKLAKDETGIHRSQGEDLEKVEKS